MAIVTRVSVTNLYWTAFWTRKLWNMTPLTHPFAKTKQEHRIPMMVSKKRDFIIRFVIIAIFVNIDRDTYYYCEK